MKLALGRFRRRLQTIPSRVVKPTMVGTGNAPLFDTTVTERSPAVCAPIIEQTDTAFPIAKQDKRFTEDPDKLCGSLLRELIGNAHRKPIPAQQLPRRRYLPHRRS